MAAPRPKSPAAKRASSPAASASGRSSSPAASSPSSASRSLSSSPATERPKSPSTGASRVYDAWVAAADAGDIKALQAACSARTPLNARYVDDKKRSLLQIAAYKGRLPMVEYLIQQKADVTSEVMFGCMVRGHGSVLATLLQGNAASSGDRINVNVVDFNRRTLLHAALDCKLTVAADWLIKNGADVHAIDGKGRSIFHCAIKNGCMDLALSLLDHHGLRLTHVDHDIALQSALLANDNWATLKRLVDDYHLPAKLPVPKSFFPGNAVRENLSLWSLAIDQPDEEKFMWLIPRYKPAVVELEGAMKLAFKDDWQRLIAAIAQRCQAANYDTRAWLRVATQLAVAGSSTSLMTLSANGFDLFASFEAWIDEGWGKQSRHDIVVGEVLLILAMLCTNVSVITQLLSFGVSRTHSAKEWAKWIYRGMTSPPKYDAALVNAAIERGSRVYRLGLTRLLVQMLHNDTTSLVYDYLLGRDLQVDLTTEGGEGFNFDMTGPALDEDFSLADFFAEH